jgi:tRNA(fMet)-specific endonuclease VapC
MYLLDTNHCSAILAGNPKIIEKLKLPNLEIVTCVVVVGELIYMAEKSEYRKDNLESVSKFLNDIKILFIDDKVSRIYGELKARLLNKFGPREKKERRRYSFKSIGVSDNDLWIASIAIKNKAIIISEDSDFNRISEVSEFLLENWI